MTGGIRASIWRRGIPVGSTEPLPFSLISSIANEVGLAPLARQSPVSGSAASRSANLLRLQCSSRWMIVLATLAASPAGSEGVSRHPSRVPPAPGWITFPPPLGGADHRLVDQLTAIGWIMVTPPLKGGRLTTTTPWKMQDLRAPLVIKWTNEFQMDVSSRGPGPGGL